MNLPRRRLLQVTAAAAAASLIPESSRAQSYPSRPVRLVVPFPAGQATDTVARLVGQGLSDRLGQAVVIENRTGAGGNIAADVVAKASPDGYTLLVLGIWNAAAGALYRKLSYDFVRDISPVAIIGNTPYLMVIHPTVPTRTVPEFIAYAKANPAKINMGSSGNGSVSHIFGEEFAARTGIRLVHVAYRSGYLPDLLAGRVQLVFGTISSNIEYITTGQLNVLAVTPATRSPMLPDVPTLGEFVPGYDAAVWYGVGAPKNVPAEVIETLNKQIAAVVSDPGMKTRLARLGVEPLSMTSAEFAAFIAAETEKWGKVIRTANIQLD